MSVTLQDIARHTGTSVSTVSRALSGGAPSQRISEETRQKIERAARELGYRPNLLARSLRTRRSHTIALLVSDIANPFFGSIATQVERQLHERGYTLMLCNSQEDLRQEQDYLRLMVQKGIDGLIVVPMASSFAALSAHLPADMPVVVLDRPVEDHPLSVSTDEEQSANLLCDVLQRAGVDRVALVSGPMSITSHRRRAGVTRQRFPISDYIEGPPQVETGRQALARIAGNIPSAIVCTNNFLGQGVLDAINGLNPRPIVACFDEIPMAHLLPIPIVMMLQDIQGLADGCVRLLMPQLSEPPDAPDGPIALPAQASTNPAFDALVSGRSAPTS